MGVLFSIEEFTLSASIYTRFKMNINHHSHKPHKVITTSFPTVPPHSEPHRHALLPQPLCYSSVVSESQMHSGSQMQPSKAWMPHYNRRTVMESSAQISIPDLSGFDGPAFEEFPIDLSGRIAKRLFDVLGGSMALIFFAPLMLCCALAIKLTSPGPVLFRQERIGYRNCRFNIWKFRTMHIYACKGDRLTECNDQRVFIIGRVLRKLSFDELPQLFNVLQGNMSLVGPRPHIPTARAAGEFYFNIIANYNARHWVKPGITGWAQVNGWRGPTESFEQIVNRVAHDFHYIDHWSLWLDIKILLKTVLVGFAGKNAF
jgi:exopolysaccharide biosynthesis polyprenyl glycosylphosphotransferase